MFLFNDLLLVAKAKSGSNFKLKDKVRVSEMWLNESPAVIDEVAEIPKSSDTSFVIGWPTTNYVAVFRLVLEKYPPLRLYVYKTLHSPSTTSVMYVKELGGLPLR